MQVALYLVYLGLPQTRKARHPVLLRMLGRFDDVTTLRTAILNVEQSEA